MLTLLIGKENTDKIIAHPNLHVISLPEPMIHDLHEGAIMVVPVGVLCDLCDKPERVAFCLCETTTVTDDEGFTITTKRREPDHHCGMSRHGEDCTCQRVTVSR